MSFIPPIDPSQVSLPSSGASFSIRSANAPLLDPPEQTPEVDIRQATKGKAGGIKQIARCLVNLACWPCARPKGDEAASGTEVPFGDPLPMARDRFDRLLLQRDGPGFDALTVLSGNNVYEAAISAIAQQMCSPQLDPQVLLREFGTLSNEVRRALANEQTPDPLRLDFELSDGRQALERFKQTLEQRVSSSDEARSLMRSRFDEKFDDTFLSHFDLAVVSPYTTLRSNDGQAWINAVNFKGEQYVLDRQIGNGDNGIAVLYRHEDGRGIVLKIPFGRHRDDTVKYLTYEVRTMLNAMGTGAGADHIVSLLGVIREQPEGLMLLLPYAEHGSLQHALPMLEAAGLEPSVRAPVKLTLMHDIVLAAYRLQIKGILHSDLTARNFLLFEDGKLRASDFGLAELFNDQDWIASAVLPKDPGLAHDDVAPEYAWGAATNLTPAADTYQVGRLLFEIVYGKSLSSMGIASRQSKLSFDPERQLDPIPAHEWPGVDTVALRSLLVRMLQADPAQRIPMKDAAESKLFLGAKVGSKETRTALVETLKRYQSNIPGSMAGATP